MDTALGQVHQVGAWVVVVGNALVGGWALLAHWHPSLRVRPLWWATIAAELSAFVQVIVGVALMNVEDIQPTDFHMLYGFSTLFAVGILYSYRHQIEEKQYLFYGAGGLFIMGLGIRAMVLHP